MTVRELIETLERYGDDDAIVSYPVYVNTAPCKSGYWKTEEITEIGYNDKNELELS